MKKILSTSVGIIMLLLLVLSTASAEDLVKWYSLKEGSIKAKTEKKPLLIDFFYGHGCPRCELFLKNIYSNEDIAKKINIDFIPVRVDLTKKLTKDEEALGQRHDFKHDCMLLFIDSEGNTIKDPEGKGLCFIDYIEPQWFIKYLDMVIENIKK